MTGTSANLGSRGGGGSALPAPKMAFMVGLPGSFKVAQENAQGKALDIGVLKNVVATFPGIPSEILKNTNKYKPLLELLRYRGGKTTSQSSVGGNVNKKSGYVHPSNAPAPSGLANFTHGGAHSDASIEVQALRQTEWPITDGEQRFDVTQGILGFMCFGNLPYRDLAGPSAVKLVYPVHKACGRGVSPGRRFPYSRAFQPGYFAFRLSILDLQDDRKKRITGPMSDKISVSNAVFPFIPAGVDIDGKTVATIANGFNGELLNFWMAGASRLPG